MATVLSWLKKANVKPSNETDNSTLAVSVLDSDSDNSDSDTAGTNVLATDEAEPAVKKRALVHIDHGTFLCLIFHFTPYSQE